MDNKHFTVQLALIDGMAERETIRCICIVLTTLIIMSTIVITAYLHLPQTRNAEGTYTSTTISENGVTTVTAVNGRSTTTIVTDKNGNLIATCITSGRR